MTRAYFNWSGGKDSALALWKVLNGKKLKVEYLLTSMNSFHDRVSMHGVRRDLLEAQASSLNIPLTTIELPEEPSMAEYETAMMNKVNWLNITITVRIKKSDKVNCDTNNTLRMPIRENNFMLFKLLSTLTG